MTKAPLGGEKTGPNPTDRGTDGVRRSLVTEGHGVPIDGARRHEMKLVRATSVRSVVEQPNPTEAQPQGMGVANGYADAAVRTIRAASGFIARIRSRGEAAKALAREAGQRARRWVVERSHSWRTRFRRLLVRWEKEPAHDLAVLHVACGVIAFRAAGLLG
jgi:transposase